MPSPRVRRIISGTYRPVSWSPDCAIHKLIAVLNRYGQKHPLGHWMSSFLDSYLARLQRDEETSGMGYMWEGDAPERQRIRVGLQSCHDSNPIAAPEVHIAAPTASSDLPLSATASLHFQAAIGMDHMTSSLSYSADSGFALPSPSTFTPTARISSNMGNAGWTPDMLALSSYLDHSATSQETFGKISGPTTPAMSVERSGYIHHGRIEAEPYGTSPGSVQQNMWSTIMPEGHPTLEEIFGGAAHSSYDVNPSGLISRDVTLDSGEKSVDL